MPAPHTTGRRIATAGCSKTNLGKVKAGIKVVIFKKA
jgi:hypothetical protein